MKCKETKRSYILYIYIFNLLKFFFEINRIGGRGACKINKTKNILCLGFDVLYENLVLLNK